VSYPISSIDPVLAVRGGSKVPVRRGLVATIRTHFWFKCLGTIGFTAAFFAAYFYLLRHPAFPVQIIPSTRFDRLIAFQAFAFPVYASLWVYVSLPLMLMHTRCEIVEYGFWMGALCLSGLAAFYFWPTAVPTGLGDWGAAPAIAFLKGIDAAGNACPSLHVAAAVYAASQLDRELKRTRIAAPLRWASAAWCVAIAYSTMATKQHVAIDVLAGALLGALFAMASRRMDMTRFGIRREQT
jgi:membrane-associated phospholipid phosphatase